MARVMASFTPAGAISGATTATFEVVNNRLTLAFDKTTNEDAVFECTWPQSYNNGTLVAYIYYFMDTVTTGNTDWDVAVEAISDGDATDLDAGDSYDTANSTDDTDVPGTAGYMDVISVTLTNKDSIAAADYVRFKLTRDAVSDTADDDAKVIRFEVRET